MNKIEIMPAIKATALASFFNKALVDADFTSNVTPRCIYREFSEKKMFWVLNGFKYRRLPPDPGTSNGLNFLSTAPS